MTDFEENGMDYNEDDSYMITENDEEQMSFVEPIKLTGNIVREVNIDDFLDSDDDKPTTHFPPQRHESFNSDDDEQHTKNKDDDTCMIDMDQVAQTFDVYISQQLADHLHLLQYPTQTIPILKYSSKISAKVQPTSKRLQFEIPLDTKGENYSKERGEKLGKANDNAPLQASFDIDLSGANRVAQLHDSQVFSSISAPTHSNFMIGAFKKGTLHLTPLTSIIQLRPSLDHLDIIYQKEKALKNRIDMEEDKEAGLPELEEEIKMVQLSVRKGENVALPSKSSNEAWENLILFDENSFESNEVRDQLYAEEQHEVKVVSSCEKYLDDLAPLALSSGKSPLEIITGCSTNEEIRTLPLAGLLKAFMISAIICTFTQVMQLVGSKANESDVLRGLQETAILIKGVWIVKSEFMYSERAKDTRDYMIYLFQTRDFIKRSEVNENAKIHHTMMLNMISEIATKDIKSGWVLKVEPDLVFIKKYPEIVANQQAIVKKRGEEALKSIISPPPILKIDTSVVPTRSKKSASLLSASTKGPKSAQSSAPASTIPSTISSNANTPSTLSLIDYPIEGATLEEQLLNLIRKIVMNHSACTGKYLSKCIDARKSDKDAENNLISSQPFENTLVMNILSRVCTKVQTVYVLKLVGNAAIDKFRAHVIDMFRSKKAQKKNDILQYCHEKTGVELSNATYMRIMKELCVSKGANWSIKESPVWT